MPSTKGHCKYEETLKVTPAAAIVEIYARSAYDGPDTLLLRSTDGESASARTYHKELTVKEQEQSGELIECAFTLSEQQGTAKTKDDLKDRRYTLVWRPTGSADEEIVLVENRDYEFVWNTGEERSVAATMTTARFQECSAVQFPSETGGLDVDLPAPLQSAYKPLDKQHPGVSPRPKPASGEAVKSRSGSGNSGSGGSVGGSSGGGAVPGATPPEIDPPSGDRWIAIYGVFATDEDDYAPPPTLLGAYKATQSGTYKRADLSGETPSGSGPEQTDVLLPTGHVGSAEVNLFARLALGSPSSARFKQGAELLQRGGGDPQDLVYATTPLFYGQPAPGTPATPQQTGAHPVDSSISLRIQRPSDYAGASEQGPGVDVRLINPMWVAERRIQAAEAAHEHYQKWMETVGAVEGHSGLVGDLCYNPAHGRGYLADRLADAPTEIRSARGRMRGRGGGRQQVKKEYDMVDAWSPFSPDQVTGASEEEPGDEAYRDVLGQVQYGLRSKRAFLSWNRQRASRRASVILGSPYLYQALLDLFASSSDTSALGPRAVEWCVRLTLSGGTVPFSDDAPDALVDAAGRQGITLKELTGMDLAAILLKAGNKAAAYKLALAMGPAVVVDWASPSGSMPTGMPELAHFYMRCAHGADDYTNVAETGDELKLAPSGSPEAEVAVVKDTVGEETRYKMRVSGQVKQEMKTSMETLKTDKIGGATAGIRVLTGVASICSVVDAIQNDRFGVGDALNLGTVGLEVASLYEESPSYSTMMQGKVPSWVGSTLKVLGPVADVTTGAWQFGQAAANTTARGQATADDPNAWGMVGAVLGTAGGITLAVGTGGVALAVGVGLTAAGGGTSLYAGLMDSWEVEAADPLADWLPTEDFWGKDFGADRTPLFDAVRPDPSAKATFSSKTLRGKKLPKAMSEQAKAVTERAFHFPTRVGVRKPKEGGAPVGLQLQIAVGYLPSYGTLMVDAGINPSSGGLVQERLECAVHYMKADGVFRYCVVPKGDRLKEPGGKNQDLSGWVEDQQWSWAAPEEIRLPNGEAVDAPMLDVHVGEWPADFDSREREQTAKYAQRMHVEKQLWVEEHLFSPLGMTGKNKASGRRQNRREAAEVAETVDPKAHWTGPERLGPILESGSFRVSGQALFRPLQPFDPDPKTPDSKERFVAIEEIQYSYP